MPDQLLDDVASLLAGASLGLTEGTNLFAGSIPNSPDAAVVLYETPGAAPLETMGDQLPAEENPRLQVQVRGAVKDYVGPRDLMWSIWKVLDAVLIDTVNGTRYNRIQAVSSPYFLNRDESERVTFVATFDVMKDLV